MGSGRARSDADLGIAARRRALRAAVASGCLALGLALLGFAPAQAHTVWLEPVAGVDGRWEVRFGGHAGKVLPVDPGKLKTVEAWDAAGKTLSVTRDVGPGGVSITVHGRPATIAMHLDNGIHSRIPGAPSVEKPLDEVPGATKATWAPKWYKAILAWDERATRPVGQRFEVVPLDAAPPRAGRPMRVRVLVDGKPAAGVRVGHGEEPPDGAPATGPDGLAEYVPTAGANRLWAGRRDAVSGNPKYTELSYEYVLGFEARP